MTRSETGEPATVQAKYIDPELAEYRGNPLIEALPPILSTEDLGEVLACYPHYTAEERGLPNHLRYHCIQWLHRYFEPLSRHFDLQERFSALLRQGYLSRNPRTPAYVKQLQNGYLRLQKRDLSAFEHDVRSTANSFAIIGCSGVGKTTAVERILSLYP